MGDVRRRAPLLIDLRDGNEPARRVPRVRWPVVILGSIALGVLKLGAERLSPGAGAAFGLGLHWLVALGSAAVFVLFRRLREGDSLLFRWQVFLAFVAVWFLARAALATYQVLP